MTINYTAKKMFLFFMFSLLCVFGKAQHNSKILGSWKVVSIFADGIYFSTVTDSTYLSAEMKEMYPDSAEQKKLLTAAKMIYSDFQFHFDKNGVFRQTCDTVFLFDGKYLDFPAQNFFELTTKNSLEQGITDKIKYILKDGLLNFSFKWDNTSFDFVLKKF